MHPEAQEWPITEPASEPKGESSNPAECDFESVPKTSGTRVHHCKPSPPSPFSSPRILGTQHVEYRFTSPPERTNSFQLQARDAWRWAKRQ